MNYLFKFLLSVFATIFLTTTVSAQKGLSFNSKVANALDKWYIDHADGYTLKIHDPKEEASIESYYSKDLETANLIRVRYKGMLATLMFHKNIAKISTHADSLYKYFDYIAITDIYTGIEIDKWKIGAATPINTYRKKDKISFQNNGLDHFSFVFDWEVYAVFAEKQTKDCLSMIESHGCGRLPNDYVMNCIESKRQKLKFKLDVDIAIQPLKAPEKKVYPNYLSPKTTLKAKEGQQILAAFAKTEQALVFEENKTKNGGEYQLLDAEGNAIWKSTIESKLKQLKLYLPIASYQDDYGNVYVGVMSRKEGGNNYHELLKFNTKGDLKWVKNWQLEESGNQYIKDIYVDEKGTVFTVGASIVAFSAQGKKLWQETLIGAYAEGYTIQAYGKDKLAVVGSAEMGSVLYFFDKKGKELVHYSYYENSIDEGEAACVTRDGGVVIAGEASGANGVREDIRIWVYKVNAKGEKIWELYAGSSKVIGFSPVRVVRAVFEQENGDLLVVANNDKDDLEVEDFGDVDGYIFCVTKDGQLKWQQSVGTINFDFINSATFQNGQLSISLNDKVIHYNIKD